MFRIITAFLLSVLALRPATAVADIRLPKVFTDHMVLQQEMPIAVWGWAEPGQTVTVTLGQASVPGKADKIGHWRVDLPPVKSDGKAYTLSVTAGDARVERKDVLLGEVWICGGQSNMGRPVTGEQAESAEYPKVRLFNVSGNVPRKEGLDDTFGWEACSPEVIRRAGDSSPKKDRRGFSEVAYVFGRRIHKELDLPVGLIQVNCGGSTAKDWTPTAGVAETLIYDQPMQRLTHTPGVLYEVRLRGLVPFTARGVVWYQGEDDGRNADYAKDFSAMIAAWRQRFGRQDLPFYFAQIAQTTYASGMLRVWEAQQWVMENVPHTGMAVSNDIYNGTTNGGFRERIDSKTGLPIAGGGNPHPTGKEKVAERLARIALDRTYGVKQGVIFGPLYQSHRVEGSKVIVKFQYTGSGLATNDGRPPNWFEVSDGTKDRNRTIYVPAKTEVVGPDTVAVWVDGVAEPKHVRFGWHPLARFNLVNREGLPALSFRTDDDPR